MLNLLFSLGRAGLKRAAPLVKRGIGALRKKAPETVKKTEAGFKKVKARTAPRRQEFKKRTDAILGAKLKKTPTDVPVPGTGAYLGGRAMDVAGLGGLGFGAVETAKSVTPLFTDEEFTKSDALMLASGIVAANPALKFGKRALSRLAGSGTFYKPRMKLDKKGKSTGEKVIDEVTGKPVKDRFVRFASPLERRRELLGFGASVPLAVGAGFLEQPGEVDKLQPLERADEQDEIFKNLALEPQMGPNMKKVADKIKQRPGQYSEEQQLQMLNEAKQLDEAQKKEAIPPEKESAENVVEQVEKEEEKIVDPPVSVAPDEIDMDKNPGQAVDDADTAAKDKILTTEKNPGGNPNVLDLPENVYADGDLHSLMAGAQSISRDYSAMNEAMDEYKRFIETEEGKVQSYDQYRKRFAEITGDNNEESANLAMFKWAMAMMTGRSNEKGLSGFLDIAGQAGMVYADDLAAIHAQNRAEEMQIANAFMAYEQDAQRYLSGLEQGRLSQIIQNERQIMDDKVADDQQLFNNRVALYQLYLEKMKYMQEIEDAKNESLAAPRKDQEFFVVDDENALFKRKKIRIGFTEEGKRVKFEFDENNNEIIVPIGPDEAQGLSLGKKLDTARLNKDLTSLIAMNQGLRFSKAVLDMEKVAKGSPGAVSQLLTDLGSLYRDWSPTAGGNLPRSAADFDTGIQDMLFSSTQLGTGERTRADNKAYNKLMKEFNKDREETEIAIADIRKNKENSKYISGEAKTLIKNAKTEKQRQKLIDDLALLRLIENRMKYIVANANKGEDRLTVADVNDAAQNTAIIRFLMPSEKVDANYRAIQKELNLKYNDLAAKYIENGGNQRQLMKHDYATIIAEYKAGLQAKEKQKLDSSNQNESLNNLINKVLGQ
tara:strand:- start:3543 stop:6200 length:2658 start_codon:yes stop_codon:yes gene_type:complete